MRCQLFFLVFIARGRKFTQIRVFACGPNFARGTIEAKSLDDNSGGTRGTLAAEHQLRGATDENPEPGYFVAHRGCFEAGSCERHWKGAKRFRAGSEKVIPAKC